MIDIRSSLQKIYSDIQKVSGNSIFPLQDTEVQSAGKLINKDYYDVVVCGEVKKGKSSFINAIIGEEILPTNIQVATSQVFRIINSEKEEYSLVFTSGEKESITKTELAKYGSQVDADMYGEPKFKNRVLDYIEVKRPIEFLPKHIALVDTPGIGAVYAAHEQITRNYLQKAAAVIFIIDPQNPITREEKSFVEFVLKQTKQIMCVMTKMDNYDANEIILKVRRNKEILSDLSSKTSTGELDVVPMSSKVLFEAAHEDIDILKEDLILQSQFDLVKNKLLTMIRNTVEKEINIGVFNSFNKYNALVMTSMNEVQTSLSDTSKAKDIAEKKRKTQIEFNTKFSTNSEEYKKVINEIDTTIIGFRNRVNDLFSISNSIYRRFQQQIDSVKSIDEVNYLAKNIGAQMDSTYGQSWKGLINQTNEEISLSLSAYNATLSLSQVPSCNIGTVVDGFVQKERTFLDHLNLYKNSYMSGMALGGLAYTILSIVFPPIAFTGLIAGLLATWGFSRKTNIDQYKQELYKYIGECFSQIRDHYLVKPIAGEHLTLCQMIETTFKKNAIQAVGEIFELQKSNLDKQVKHLEEMAQADTVMRQKKMEQLANAKMIWQKTHTLLNEVKQELNKSNK